MIISTVIVQYGFGRCLPGNFRRKNTLNDNLGRPSAEIRSLLGKLQGWRGAKKLQDNMMKYLAALLKVADFSESRYPGTDREYCSKRSIVTSIATRQRAFHAKCAHRGRTESVTMPSMHRAQKSHATGQGSSLVRD